MSWLFFWHTLSSPQLLLKLNIFYPEFFHVIFTPTRSECMLIALVARHCGLHAQALTCGCSWAIGLHQKLIDTSAMESLSQERLVRWSTNAVSHSRGVRLGIIRHVCGERRLEIAVDGRCAAVCQSPEAPRGEDLGAQSFARTLAASLSLQLHCTNRVTKRNEFSASTFLYTVHVYPNTFLCPILMCRDCK